ncbi:uncharacterized protein LOC108912095 isoform X2 [Anoplophora glabripennis]|uniref:uncharacterized protein LOC108912095 isoform X2 n=1 Tax=Anoplophora glabripennis TaxID=217634 RepID=UPI000C790FF9|nr:uncharacterized protein LOC108912095 isoform X2 [Anoplophora glabripennis]
MVDQNDEYKITNMQRCPYIHEMKERLLGEQVPMEIIPKKIPTPPPFAMDQQQQQLVHQQPVATVVKLNPDGYGSHTSPTHQRPDRTPLMPKEPEDDFHYVHRKVYPKNAKTSLFIIMSFVYAKLLVVVCIAYVISDVVTHSIPLYYYEGFFTYLYGMSILFLLYVFCFLLQESSCCSGGGEKQAKQPPPKQKSKEKEKEKEKKKEEEKKKKEEKERQKKEKKEKEKDKDKKNKKQEKQEDADNPISLQWQFEASTYRRNSEGVVDAGLAEVPVPVAEISQSQAAIVVSQEQPPAAPAAPPPPAAAVQPAAPLPAAAANNAGGADVEAGVKAAAKCKRKTTQNDQSHGSFFLRIGAIAFGLGTMIYNGLEFGTFFEVPFTSSCYMILHGVNPVLQMIFTFMQMYFIFMNSRLNIHRFKVVARFGLMHVVATNICVWIRTLVIEYLKEISNYHMKMFNSTLPNDISPYYAESFRLPDKNTLLGTPKQLADVIKSTASNLATTLPTTSASFRDFFQTTVSMAATTLSKDATTLPTTTSTPSVEESILTQDLGNAISSTDTELIDEIIPQSLKAFNETVNGSDGCGRVNIMGTIVQESGPYLYPFIIEYSLIGAAVIYVMWKHIGRNPRYVTQEDLEHRLEIMLSRRAVALAHAQQGRVDCVGASKGLFFGLLMLVGSLICLILFFVLVQHKDFGLLAIYLADVSHCVLMVLSIIAIIIGFIRVQSLKFKTEEQSDLNDILLRVSAFGLFLYAAFSIIAGHQNAFTKEPNLLVMITGILSVVQVVLQLLFIADVSRRRVHLPEHDRSKPGRQVVTFLLICNVTMWIIYTFEMQKVEANPVQLKFYGFLAWAIVQRLTLPLCIFHRFHSAVTLAEIWKTSYKARLE